MNLKRIQSFSLKIVQVILRIFNNHFFGRFYFKKILNEFLFIYNVKIDFKKNGLIKLSENKQEIYITRLGRLTLYYFGIQNRIDNLLKQYCINDLEIPYEETIIDIGANIGEVSNYFEKKGYNVISFEPDPTEFIALKTNCKNSLIYNKGLWNKKSKLRFFLNNKTGDSSFLPENLDDKNFIEIETCTLDSMIMHIDRIGLIKLEAEGAEPEILEGAKNSLLKTRFISVDVGPERGVNKDSTLMDVSNFLFRLNFSIVKFNHKRLTIVFSNNKINV